MNSEQNTQEEGVGGEQEGSSQGEGERLPEPNKVDATPDESVRPERLPDANIAQKNRDPASEKREG